jgi:acetate kinase
VTRCPLPRAGLLSLFGVHDCRGMTQRRAAGDAAASLAFDVYAYGVRKYVGAYDAGLGELYAVVLTGGIASTARS